MRDIFGTRVQHTARKLEDAFLQIERSLTLGGYVRHALLGATAGPIRITNVFGALEIVGTLKLRSRIVETSQNLQGRTDANANNFELRTTELLNSEL